MSDLSIMTADDRRRAQLDRVMVWAVIATGTVAAMTVDRAFWAATPLLAMVLVRASRREAVVVESVESGPSEMPPRVELAVHAAIQRLAPGDARRLLGDVVRQARPLFGITSSRFDEKKDAEARDQAADLVLASCDTALELARVDALLDSDARVSDGKTPMTDAGLVERYRTARTGFATRLSDAASALGSLYAAGVEHGTPASDRVAELAAELSADAKARSEATTEMDQFLDPPSSRGA